MALQSYRVYGKWTSLVRSDAVRKWGHPLPPVVNSASQILAVARDKTKATYSHRHLHAEPVVIRGQTTIMRNT